MELTVTLLAFAVVLIALFWISDRLCLRQERKAQEHTAQVTTMAGLSHALDRLTEVMAKVDPALFKQAIESTSGISGLMEGLTGLIKAEASKVDALNRAVDILEASMAPAAAEDDYERYADKPLDIQKQQEMRDLIRRGVDPEEARARVSERDIYSQVARSRR